MFILKLRFPVLILKEEEMHFEAGKIQINAVPNRSEFHGPPLRLWPGSSLVPLVKYKNLQA